MTTTVGAFNLFTASLRLTFIRAPALFLLAAPFIGAGFLTNLQLFGLSAAFMEYDYWIDRGEWLTIAASVAITVTSFSAAYGFIAAYLLNARNGRRFQITACLHILSLRLFRLTISQFVAFFALTFGFFTIAGGLWLSGLWAVSSIVVMAEKGEGMGFIRSAQLTRNHRWSLGVASTCIILANTALSFGMTYAIGEDPFDFSSPLGKSDVFVFLLQSTISPMFTAPFAFMTYQRLLELKQGATAEIEEVFR